MKIRKATENDIDSIAKIYEAIHDEEEKGMAVIGWKRNVYPTRKTAEDGVKRGDLFVLEDEESVMAAAVINQIQVAEYRYAAWKHTADDAEVMVLHALVVDPHRKGRGYGKAFVSFYEDYAREHHCVTLRMDTNARNAGARNLYHKLGYEEIGIVTCIFNGIPDVQLVCLEKYLA